MHAAYNVQHLVVKGFVFAYTMSQARTDYSGFILVLSSFFDNFGVFPKRVCADAGYGNYANYKFLEDHGIGNFVKYQEFEGNVLEIMPDSYTLCEDGTITCLNGGKGMATTIENRHPKKKNSVFYVVEGCSECPFADCCKGSPETKTRTSKSSKSTGTCRGTDSRRRTIRFPSKGLKSESTEPYRSKALQDYGSERLGMNIAKLFRYFETGRQSGFWTTPENLKPEKKGKPSAKRLSKTGRRIHDGTYAKYNASKFDG